VSHRSDRTENVTYSEQSAIYGHCNI